MHISVYVLVLSGIKINLKSHNLIFTVPQMVTKEHSLSLKGVVRKTAFVNYLSFLPWKALPAYTKEL